MNATGSWRTYWVDSSCRAGWSLRTDPSGQVPMHSCGATLLYATHVCAPPGELRRILRIRFSICTGCGTDSQRGINRPVVREVPSRDLSLGSLCYPKSRGTCLTGAVYHAVTVKPIGENNIDPLRATVNTKLGFFGRIAISPKMKEQSRAQIGLLPACFPNGVKRLTEPKWRSTPPLAAYCIVR